MTERITVLNDIPKVQDSSSQLATVQYNVEEKVQSKLTPLNLEEDI